MYFRAVIRQHLSLIVHTYSAHSRCSQRFQNAITRESLVFELRDCKFELFPQRPFTNTKNCEQKEGLGAFVDNAVLQQCSASPVLHFRTTSSLLLSPLSLITSCYYRYLNDIYHCLLTQSYQCYYYSYPIDITIILLPMITSIFTTAIRMTTSLSSYPRLLSLSGCVVCV